MQRLGLKPDLTGMGGRYKTATAKIWFINSHLCHILEFFLYLSLGKDYLIPQSFNSSSVSSLNEPLLFVKL